MPRLLSSQALGPDDPVESHAQGTAGAQAGERFEFGADVLAQSALKSVEHMSPEIQDSSQTGKESRMSARLKAP
jgi:hypothetical protein